VFLPVKITQQQGIIEWNFKELNEQLDEQLRGFKNVVVTEDQLSEYIPVLANLNKVATLIEDERKRIKKEYSKPLVEFESQVKELTNKILSVRSEIDNQVKTFEEERRAKKKELLLGIFEEENEFEWLTFDRVFNDKWLNKGTTINQFRRDIGSIFEKIEKDLILIEIEDIQHKDLFLSYYREELDYAVAKTRYHDTVSKLNATKEPPKKETPMQNEVREVSFRVVATIDVILEIQEILDRKAIGWNRL